MAETRDTNKILGILAGMIAYAHYVLAEEEDSARAARVLERAYWCETHPNWPQRQEVAAAVEYIAAVAEIRGWPTEKRP